MSYFQPGAIGIEVQSLVTGKMSGQGRVREHDGLLDILQVETAGQSEQSPPVRKITLIVTLYRAT
jgi:hypothetical protein